jgi:transposase InsO family protein
LRIPWEEPRIWTTKRAEIRQTTDHGEETVPANLFTSPPYRESLLAADVQISMDGKGRALDNIFVERLWRWVKYEMVSSQMTNFVSCAGAA